MSNTKTPKQVLSSLLLGAAREAELWATNLSLNTFPDTSWDDPAVQKHPTVIDGWRWENWDELQNDCNRWAWLADTAADCPKVQEEYLRLINAQDVINTFVTVVGGHTDEFCK